MARAELHRAVDALRAGRHQEALELLRASTGEPPEIEARRLGMLAQAELALGQLDAAKGSLRAALKLARQLGDEQGVAQLRTLNGQIYARLAEELEQARLRAAEAEAMRQPLERLLAGAKDEAERAMVYVRKANAQIDGGQDGAALAEQGLHHAEAAGSPRARVLARLCLARAHPADQERLLREAHAIADLAEEPQLLAAIVRAGQSVGLDLVSYRF